MTRRVRAKTVSLLVLVVLITGLASRAVIGAAVIQADTVRYVSPSGSDANDGSADRPLKTIQKALDLSEPGGVIQLAPGRYAQDFATVRAGVTISGPEDAIVVGAGGALSLDLSQPGKDGFLAVEPPAIERDRHVVVSGRRGRPDRATNSSRDSGRRDHRFVQPERVSLLGHHVEGGRPVPCGSLPVGEDVSPPS